MIPCRTTLSSFALAVALDGNGFIAAFVAGIAFGAGWHDESVSVEEVGELPELLGEVLAFVVWFLFGAVLVPVAFHAFDVWVLAHALLSLTLVRLLPVALALLGTGLDRGTVLFIGCRSETPMSTSRLLSKLCKVPDRDAPVTSLPEPTDTTGRMPYGARRVR